MCLTLLWTIEPEKARFYAVLSVSFLEHPVYHQTAVFPRNSYFSYFQCFISSIALDLPYLLQIRAVFHFIKRLLYHITFTILSLYTHRKSGLICSDRLNAVCSCIQSQLLLQHQNNPQDNHCRLYTIACNIIQSYHLRWTL